MVTAIILDIVIIFSHNYLRISDLFFSG